MNKFICTSLLLCLSTASAHACGVEQFAIQNFQAEVDQWSDGSGEVVRIMGTVTSACQKPAQVEIMVEASGGGSQKPVWLLVPPGGMPFDLTGAIPYSPGAGSYQASLIRVR